MMNKFEKNPNPKTSYAYIVRQGMRPVRSYMWSVLMREKTKRAEASHQSFFRFMDNWSVDWNTDSDDPNFL